MLTKELIVETILKMEEDKFEDIDVLLERLVILDKYKPVLSKQTGAN